VAPGLNLLAICRNKNCVASDKQICIIKRFGTFHIGEEMFNCICPACQKETDQATNFGYFKTKISIQGKRNGSKEKYELQETVVKH
jgi:hypothetical protein